LRAVPNTVRKVNLGKTKSRAFSNKSLHSDIKRQGAGSGLSCSLSFNDFLRHFVHNFDALP
jgi:hypothetical protein